jgi:hypothetical protein
MTDKSEDREAEYSVKPFPRVVEDSSGVVTKPIIESLQEYVRRLSERTGLAWKVERSPYRGTRADLVPLSTGSPPWRAVLVNAAGTRLKVVRINDRWRRQ